MSEGRPSDPLARLGERLDKARGAARRRTGAPATAMPAQQQALGIGFRIGIEFVVAIVVATGLGWAIDRCARHPAVRDDRVVLSRGRGRHAERLSRDHRHRGRPSGSAGRRRTIGLGQTMGKTDVALELHPLEQFKIEPLIPLHIGGLDISYTNSALFMTIVVVADHRAAGARDAPRRAGARAMAVDRRDELRVRRRHGRDQCRARRPSRIFPFVFTLFMFVLFAQPARADPLQLHGHQPHHRHLRAGRWSCSSASRSSASSSTARISCGCSCPRACRWCCCCCWCRSSCCRISSGRSRCRSGCSPTCWPGTRCWRSSAGSPPASASWRSSRSRSTSRSSALEVLVAALQAYVFAILTCLYLRDALHLH